MSYDLGVLNLKGNKKKTNTKMYAMIGVVVIVVVLVVALKVMAVF